MTRQWLAFLALLTGLAAVGAPVNAQAAQALSCEIGAAAEAGNEAQVVAAEISNRAEVPLRSRAVGLDFAVQNFAPRAHWAVFIGIDRAYE